jgi:hypothetical protein
MGSTPNREMMPPNPSHAHSLQNGSNSPTNVGKYLSYTGDDQLILPRRHAQAGPRPRRASPHARRQRPCRSGRPVARSRPPLRIPNLNSEQGARGSGSAGGCPPVRLRRGRGDPGPMASANIGTIRANCPESCTAVKAGHRLLARIPKAWRRRNGLNHARFQKMADFRHFSHLARRLQYLLHDRRMVRWSAKGD